MAFCGVDGAYVCVREERWKKWEWTLSKRNYFFLNSHSNDSKFEAHKIIFICSLPIQNLIISLPSYAFFLPQCAPSDNFLNILLILILLENFHTSEIPLLGITRVEPIVCSLGSGEWSRFSVGLWLADGRKINDRVMKLPKGFKAPLFNHTKTSNRLIIFYLLFVHLCALGENKNSHGRFVYKFLWRRVYWFFIRKQAENLCVGEFQRSGEGFW